MDCNLPGPSIHGIFQARVLEWVAIAFSTIYHEVIGIKLWCWRRLLRIPWTARRSNQSILKEFNPGISLKGMMLKLKLQYFGHLIRRVDSLEKNPVLRWIGGRRRRGRPRMRWLNALTGSNT